jgi:predicted nucleic acid-binding Zn ribbon protein
VPTYLFRCPDGHHREIVMSIHDELPTTVACQQLLDSPEILVCEHVAERVFLPPAAIHFKGRGFYATDVTGAQQRRRRPNPGDDLYRGHDPDAAAIARSL